MIGDTGELLKRVDPWLTAVAGGAASALRPRHRPAAEGLLVVRPGGMGDLILAHLAAEQLGLTDQIQWLVEARSAGWAAHAGLRHLCYDRDPRAVLAAIGGRYEHVVNTEQRFGLSMAASRWGLARRGVLTAFDTNRGARQADRVVTYDWREAHELDEFGRLLAAATARQWPGGTQVARRRGTDGTWVVSLGGTHSASRRLSTSEWERLIRTLVGDRDVVMTAGPLEQALAADLRDRLGSRARLFTGSFEDVVERISTAERLIAVDGGPVHVASYYGVPVDVVFTAGRSHKWAPLARGSIVHRRDDLPCQPCTVFGQVPPCPYSFRCRADVPGSLQAFPIGPPASVSDR